MFVQPCLNGTAPTDERCPIEPVPFRGAPCSDAAGTEKDYRFYGELLARSPTGRHWSDGYASWWFNYVDDVDGSVHQVWMDDVVSLRVKYGLVAGAGLRGVGMWAADFLNYSRPLLNETREMWVAIGEAASRGVAAGGVEVVAEHMLAVDVE